MPIELYPSIAKVKRGGVYQNLPGFAPETGNEAVEAMIANSETSTTAQFFHPKFSFFILNNTLYQADSNINVNDIIAAGSNCHVEPLGNSVYELINNQYFVTPEMFGAIGDGVEDDTQAFVSAIQSGCKYIFLNRTYLITEKLDFSNTVCFIGMPKATVKLSGEAQLFLRRTSNIEVRNIKFISDSGTKPAVHIYYADYTFIDNCEFDTLYGAITAETGNNIHITNCYIHDCTTSAIAIIGDGDTLVISNCTIEDNVCAGTSINGGRFNNATICNNIYSHNGDAERGGINVQGLNTHGILNSRIYGNIFKNNIGVALDISGHSNDNIPRAQYIEVFNNIMYGNGAGIVICSALDVNITNNKISGGNMGISIITSASGTFGDQNINILSNTFGDFPESTGSYQGVITFGGPDHQVRNINIENNTFGPLSVNAQPYISVASMNFSSQDAANLVSNIHILNNDFKVRANETGRRNMVYAYNNAYKPYPVDAYDEKSYVLFGTTFENIQIAVPARKRIMITRVEAIANNLLETASKITFTIGEPGVATLRFNYTNQNITDYNRTFTPSSWGDSAIKYVLNATATAPITLIVYYTELC